MRIESEAEIEGRWGEAADVIKRKKADRSRHKTVIKEHWLKREGAWNKGRGWKKV